jgi:pseudouridine-5'-phosphate glycosidase
MTNELPEWIHVHPDVTAAFDSGTPVVALESSVLTHGLPQPINLELANRIEAEVLANGSQPATIALLEGVIHVGLSQEELNKLLSSPELCKISRRDLGVVVAKGQTGGTTVASTMFIASITGAQVFATGGIGGVHRGATGDISADLPELARTPVAVICSGAKSILDLPRTLELLETLGIPVIGWQTDEFPAFFSCKSGLPVSTRVDTPIEAAAILRSHWDMGLGSGALICVPCPEDAAVPNEIIEEALSHAEEEALSSGVRGKDLTPFLLNRVADISQGATLQANVSLLLNNARVAAMIAKAMD